MQYINVNFTILKIVLQLLTQYLDFKNYTLKFLVQQKQLTEMVRDMYIIYPHTHGGRGRREKANV